MIAERVASPEQVGLSPGRLQRIDRLFEAYVERGVIAGAVTLIGRGGQVAHLAAHGRMDLESARPMQRDTLFRLASMTKPVVSVAILMLLEEGKLLLTEPVSKFLPQFRDLQVAVPNQSLLPGVATQLKAGDFHLVPAEREITIRDLLTHTSGLGSATVGPGLASMAAVMQAGLPAGTLAEVVPSMAATPLSFQPGTVWEYSPAFAFDMLGRIVEIVSEQTLDVFMRERIFEPLGMRDTAFHVPGRSHVAARHALQPRQWRAGSRHAHRLADHNRRSGGRVSQRRRRPGWHRRRLRPVRDAAGQRRTPAR